MTVVEMTYQILVLLAFSDREKHQNEILSIDIFLATHSDKITRDRATTLHNEIFRSTQEQRFQLLIDHAEHLKHNTTTANKVRIIRYSLELILADHKVTNEEKSRFKVLGSYWDIDLEKYIAKILKKSNI